MRKNRFFRLLLAALAASVVFAACADARVIKVGHTGTKDHYYQMYLENWAKAVTERTNGRYTFEIYPSDLYGKPTSASNNLSAPLARRIIERHPDATPYIILRPSVCDEYDLLVSEELA